MMRIPICTPLALVLAVLSLVLTIGWFVNAQSHNDRFEESGFFVDLVSTIAAICLAIGGFVRRERWKNINFAATLLALPGTWLCAKVHLWLLSFGMHGDT